VPNQEICEQVEVLHTEGVSIHVLANKPAVYTSQIFHVIYKKFFKPKLGFS
jgi:hypothetical protein